MKHRPPVEPTRLRDLPPEDDLVGVSELLRDAMPLADLAPASRQRIRGRLREALTPATTPRQAENLRRVSGASRDGLGWASRASSTRTRWPFGLRPVVILVVALVGASVGGAAVQSMIAERRHTRAALAADPQSRIAPGREQKRRRAHSPRTAPPESGAPGQLEPLDWGDLDPATEVSVPAQAAAPAEMATPGGIGLPATPSSPGSTPDTPGAAMGREPRRRPVASRTLAEAAPEKPVLPTPATATSPESFAPPATSVPATPPPEAALLADAIRKLRADGDPDAALALLDKERARFSETGLALEAAAIRIEALLKAHRTGAALAELDRFPLDAVPSPDDWRVLRGELRAAAARWREAEADFSAALAGRLGEAEGDLAERALWGRAVARERLNDAGGAVADYDRYLARFPAGRFADEARRTGHSAAQPGARAR